MNINPGGTLPPDQVVGRDALIERYWQILDVQSLSLVAPRRVGKSCILRRMEALPPERFLVRRRDLQDRRTVSELVADLVSDAQDLLPASRRGQSGAIRMLKLLGVELNAGPVRLDLSGVDWRPLLEGVFDDLQAAATAAQKTLVLCWDEFTWFLHNLVGTDAAGRSEAERVLDRLRAIRQSGRHGRLRMVFTGSIGMEEVLLRMRAAGYGNDPLNDVDRQVVPELGMKEATELARLLLEDKGADELEVLAAEIASVCEGHPYFVQRVAQRLVHGGRLEVAAVGPAIEQLLRDDQDPMELRQYLERIDLYLSRDVGRMARRLLDPIAQHPETATLKELESATGFEREAIQDVLRFLRRDLYVVQEANRYRFRSGLLRRWWCYENGLDLV
jgi:hypothetical protein